MRIIIVSDNHGNQNILKILYHIYSSLYKDNVKFIHLGDSQTTSINDLNNFICVKGNNDTLDLPKFQRLTVLDKRIHFSHGDEGLDEIKKDIGVIFQEVAVFQELTVYENIDYFCGLYINDKEIRRKYVMDAINLVGLNDFIKFYPKELSGGLLRRLNIACGIAHKPKLIFLDEPTVAVDPQSRNNILDGIKKLRDEGATIVYTTHYMEEVEIICDRIIILDKGKIIAKGTTDELKTLAKLEEKITVEVKNISEETLKEIKEFKTVLDLSYQGNTLVIGKR